MSYDLGKTSSELIGGMARRGGRSTKGRRKKMIEKGSKEEGEAMEEKEERQR